MQLVCEPDEREVDGFAPRIRARWILDVGALYETDRHSRLGQRPAVCLAAAQVGLKRRPHVSAVAPNLGDRPEDPVGAIDLLGADLHRTAGGQRLSDRLQTPGDLVAG